MLNQRLDAIGDGPFQRLAKFIEDKKPPSSILPIDLAIGEPQTGCPSFVADIIEKNRHLYSKYPPTKGTLNFRIAAANWLNKRYNLPNRMVEAESHIAPVCGTKEGMFMLAQVAIPHVNQVERPIALLPNPYYHAYVGAVLAAGAEPIFVPAVKETNYLPNFSLLDESILSRTALCILCSPSNPQGAVASLPYLDNLISLARKYDFIIMADECYGEIYRDTPPPGILEACSATKALDNVVVFHSLSKRSSAPGLRVGFAAGDPAIIDSYVRLRSYGGAVVPLSLEAAATALWQDEHHVTSIRESYKKKFDIAEDIIGSRLGFFHPDGGFFLWLDVGDSLAALEALWRKAAIKVLPGEFLAKNVNGNNPGKQYIRVPLVHDIETTTEALERISRTL